MPSGFIAAQRDDDRPGTKFATPAPSTAQIHGGITTGCAGCHESGTVVDGRESVSARAERAERQFDHSVLGFNNRPGKAAGTYTLLDNAHPTSGDCSQCHGNTNLLRRQH